jgi:hypothetical protein
MTSSGIEPILLEEECRFVMESEKRRLNAVESQRATK